MNCPNCHVNEPDHKEDCAKAVMAKVLQIQKELHEASENIKNIVKKMEERNK